MALPAFKRSARRFASEQLHVFPGRNAAEVSVGWASSFWTDHEVSGVVSESRMLLEPEGCKAARC